MGEMRCSGVNLKSQLNLAPALQTLGLMQTWKLDSSVLQKITTTVPGSRMYLYSRHTRKSSTVNEIWDSVALSSLHPTLRFTLCISPLCTYYLTKLMYALLKWSILYKSRYDSVHIDLLAEEALWNSTRNYLHQIFVPHPFSSFNLSIP
jgi:hypothetical protein